MQKIIAFFCCLPLWWACGGSEHPEPPGTVATPRDTLREVVKLVRQQSRLYTAECRVHKVVLFSDETKVGGGLLEFKLPGDRKVAIPLDVTLKGYIDFGQFSAANVDRGDSVLVVTLPDPQVAVTASRIDHKQVRQYLSLGRSSFSEEEITRLAAQGEDSIEHHLERFGIVEASRASAARILVPLLCRMGFKEENIVVRFRKTYTDSDLRRMVEPLNREQR